MKKNLLKTTALLLLSIALYSCNKKEEGVCYCKYVSGDKKEFNLSMLTRSQQTDSCYVLDGYAEAFGGDCDLE